MQPNPLSFGVTAVEPRTDLDVSTSDSDLALVRESVTLQQLVDGLNALGISPARPHRHPSGDQGRRRAAGRDRGALMADPVSIFAPTSKALGPIGKLRAQAEELEGVFLNTLMSQMFSSIETDGRSSAAASPRKPGARCSPSSSPSAMAESGGIGLADQLVSELMKLQEAQGAS